MIRYSGITDGKPTYGFSRSRKSNPSRIPLYHIPSLSDSSELFAVNILITPSFGMRRTLNENLARFYIFTTIPALISLSMGTHPLKLAASINRQSQNSATIHGYHTAMDFFRRQLLHELEFAQDRCRPCRQHYRSLQNTRSWLVVCALTRTA